MIMSLDTETTGLDLKHGALPFFITIALDQEEDNVKSWEFEVDPISRKPKMSKSAVFQVRNYIRDASEIVLQNGKFDYAALLAADPEFLRFWDWGKVHDTLIAGHLLASNKPHNLTDMGVQYLDYDIEPSEKALKEACVKARRWARSKKPEWRIAKSGYADMPSARDKNWKFDTWLPRAIALDQKYEEGHPWYTVLRQYANDDSQITLLLWKSMRELLAERKLTRIYQERMKVVPIAIEMEQYGVTISKPSLDMLTDEYKKESRRLGQRCLNIASDLGWELELPRTGNNLSLTRFCFGYQPTDDNDVPTGSYYEGLGLPIVSRSKKTGAPSLNKAALDKYSEILSPRSQAIAFIKALKSKRKRDTSITYMKGYQRFWRPVTCSELGVFEKDLSGWFRLHPSLNPTGTDTLRWSSSNPNEQNISKQGMPCSYCSGSGCEECNGKGIDPRSLRMCFGPAPGREWWSNDAKNIELRIPVYESGEEEMVALFERPDDPPFYGSNHTLIFSVIWEEIWQKALRDVGPEKAAGFVKKEYKDSYYQWTKNGNFAVLYGAVDKADGTGTADRAYHQKGAQAKISKRFKKQEALNQNWIRYANRYGCVETMPDRTVDPKRGYPLLCTRTERGAIKPTVPLNYHVQGTAMWWMMKAMIRVSAFYKDLNSGKMFQGKKWPGGYYLVMQVHDELVSDMPSGKGKGPNPYDYNLPIAKEVARLMTLGGDDIGLPTPVSIEYHEVSWAEGVGL